MDQELPLNDHELNDHERNDHELSDHKPNDHEPNVHELDDPEVAVSTGFHWRLPQDFMVKGEKQKPQVKITVEGSGPETLSVVAYDMADPNARKLFAVNNENGPLSHTGTYQLPLGSRRLRFVMLGVNTLAEEIDTNTDGHPTRLYICRKPATVGDGTITITIVVQAGTIPDEQVI